MPHEILIYNQTKREIPEIFIKNVTLRALDFLKLKQPAALAVLIVSPQKIKKLNKVWRNKNESADELSFGLNSRGKAKLAKKQNKMLELGEIVINVRKISDKKNLSKILIHALLHLLGHHHEKSEREAKKTERLEEKIFKFLDL